MFGEFLELWLWHKDLHNTNYTNLGFCDIHEWIGDVTHYPPMKGKPNAMTLIISERLMQVFKDVLISNHKIYFLKVKKEISNEERVYYCIHFFNNIFSDLLYNQVSFIAKTRRDQIKSYEVGEIKNYQEYEEELKNLRIHNSRVSLVAKRYIYKNPYDLLPAIDGSIVISEKLAKKVSQYQGVELNESQVPIVTGYHE